jgi:hypothetical protein
MCQILGKKMSSKINIWQHINNSLCIILENTPKDNHTKGGGMLEETDFREMAVKHKDYELDYQTPI